MSDAGSRPEPPEAVLVGAAPADAADRAAAAAAADPGDPDDAADAPAAAESGDPDRHRDPFDPRIVHRVALIDRGPFAVAVCAGCGWESFARRSRGLARAEGRDHELLHQAS